MQICLQVYAVSTPFKLLLNFPELLPPDLSVIEIRTEVFAQTKRSCLCSSAEHFARHILFIKENNRFTWSYLLHLVQDRQENVLFTN